MKKSWILLAMVVLLVAAAVAGCGSSGGDSSGSATTAGGGSSSLSGQSIAFANFTEAAPQFVTLREHLQKFAKTAGADLSLYNNEADPQTTLSNAQLIAQRKPDAVLEYSPDPSIASSLEASFSRSGTPCVAVNVPLGESCKWFDLDNQTLCGEIGQALGEVAAERHWTGADTRVILVDAAAAGKAVNTCMGFFYEVLQDEVPGLAKISSFEDITPETTSVGETTVQVDGAALREASFKAVSGALQGIPANDHVILFSSSDDSALGSWRAVEQAGRASDTITAGIVGGPETLKELRTNPSWVAQGTVFYESWGQYLLAMAKAVEEGAQTPKMTTSPSAVLTLHKKVPGTNITPITTYYHPGESVPYKLPPLESVRQAQTSGFGVGTVGNDYLAATGVLQQFADVEGLK